MATAHLNGALALSAIGQIAMPVRDPVRATAFYGDVLRLPSESAAHDHPGSILCFRMSDLTAAHAELTARGVGFERPPHRIATLAGHEVWLAFFGDGEGNTLALMGEVPLGEGPA